MPVRILASQQGSPAGRTGGGSRKCSAEQNPFCGEPLEVRRCDRAPTSLNVAPCIVRVDVEKVGQSHEPSRSKVAAHPPKSARTRPSDRFPGSLARRRHGCRRPVGSTGKHAPFRIPSREPRGARPACGRTPVMPGGRSQRPAAGLFVLQYGLLPKQAEALLDTYDTTSFNPEAAVPKPALVGE